MREETGSEGEKRRVSSKALLSLSAKMFKWARAGNLSKYLQDWYLQDWYAFQSSRIIC
jgi:hypothetical protein